MKPVVPEDPAGKKKKHRTQRILIEVEGRLIPVCWTVLAHDGSISFGMAGDVVFSKTGEASFGSTGSISLDTKVALDDVPAEERMNTHVTIHPSGVCHIRAGKRRPVLSHDLSGWYPVRVGFRWLQAFTAPVRLLREVHVSRSRDAIMPFPSLTSSARIEAFVLPRTGDASVPLLSESAYTFAGIGPHHILRLTIDDHAPVNPTLILRSKMGEVKSGK